VRSQKQKGRLAQLVQSIPVNREGQGFSKDFLLIKNKGD